MLARAREKGLDRPTSRELGAARARLPEFVAAGRSWSSTSTVLDDQSAVDYADLIRRAVASAERPPRRAARPVHATSSSTSTRTPTPARSPCSRRWRATDATSSWSATPTSRSTASAGPTSAASSTSPSTFPHADGEPAPVVALRTTRRFGSRLLRGVPARSPPRIGARRRHPAPTCARRSVTRRRRRPRSATAGSRYDVRHRPGRDRAPRRPAPSGASRARHGLVRDGRAGAVGRSTLPALRRSLAAAGVPVEVASDDTPLVREPAVMPLLAALRVVVDARRRRPDDPRVRGRRPRRGAADLARSEGSTRQTSVPWRGRCAPGRRSAPRRPGRRASSRELLRDAPCSTRRLPRRAAGGSPGPLPAGWPPAGRGPATGSTAAARPRRCSGCCGAAPTGGRGSARPTRHGGNAARFAHRDLDALCALFEAAGQGRGAARAHQRAELPRHPHRPGDPRRHAGRPRSARRRRAAADRPPVQGPRVAARGRRSRAGGRLARPASPRLAAPCRPDRPPTACCRRSSTRLDAGRGAAAVLRRLHPRPRAPRRDRRGLARRRGRAAVPLRPRARARARAQGRAGRRARCPCRDWWPSCDAPSPIPRQPEALRRAAAPAGPAGREPRWAAAGRPQADPGDVVGDARLSSSDRPLREPDEPVVGLREHAAVAPGLPREVVPRA